MSPGKKMVAIGGRRNKAKEKRPTRLGLYRERPSGILTKF
jgi:hypothetical protein